MDRNMLILSVYILTFLVGLPANLVSLCVFSIKVHSKPSPSDILLLNLTVSDLLFLIILPLKMHETASGMTWTLPSFLCPITSFVFFSTIYTSSLLLMCVSVDRYLGVAFPVRYRLMKKPVYAIVACMICWIISSAECSIVFFTEYLLPGRNTSTVNMCYDNFSQGQLHILLPVRLQFFFVIFLVPLLICMFCYLNCIRILYAQPRICYKKKKKAIGMALGTLLVFVVCFLPYNSSHVYGYIYKTSPGWRYYSLLLSTFNTCLDPIIFYFSSSIFQTTIKNFVKFLGVRSLMSEFRTQSKAATDSGSSCG